jgi:hypothetical protein
VTCAWRAPSFPRVVLDEICLKRIRGRRTAASEPLYAVSVHLHARLPIIAGTHRAERRTDPGVSHRIGQLRQRVQAARMHAPGVQSRSNLMTPGYFGCGNLMTPGYFGCGLMQGYEQLRLQCHPQRHPQHTRGRGHVR